MRLFIGINISDETKKLICKLQQELRGQALSGSWPLQDSFHITLKFLGEVDNSLVQKISVSLKNIGKNLVPFRLKIGNMGCFVSNKIIRVVWLGVHGDINILNDLFRQVDNDMNKLGFEKEKRSFSPHITVARKVHFRKPFADIKKSVSMPSFNDLEVNKIVLFKSEQINGKRVYIPIDM